MSADNEALLAEVNDALRAEIAAQRTRWRRVRHVVLGGAYAVIIVATVTGAVVDVLFRRGSMLDMVLALVIVGWAGKDMRGALADDEPAPVEYDEDAGEEEDAGEAGDRTGVRVEGGAVGEAEADDSGEHEAAGRAAR